MRRAVERAVPPLVRRRFDPSAAQGLDTVLELRVSGAPFALRIADGRCQVEPGQVPEAAARVSVGLRDSLRLAAGTAAWPQLLSTQRLVITGDPFLGLRFPTLFRFPAGTVRPMAVKQRVGKAAASKPVSWFMRTVANPIDAWLMVRTGGRLRTSVGMPSLLIEVPGARSGVIRRTPLIFVPDGENLVVVASATGIPKLPAWYHNVMAAERFKVYAPRGRTGMYTAREAEGEERERLWQRARQMYAGFDVYEERIAGGRKIPVLVLSPASSSS